MFAVDDIEDVLARLQPNGHVRYQRRRGSAPVEWPGRFPFD